MVYSNSRKLQRRRFIGMKTFKLNDRISLRLFVLIFSGFPVQFLFLCLCTVTVDAYRCTCRVQFYEGEHVGVPTGVATFNKGRRRVYVYVLGVLVSTALGAGDDVAVWTRIVSSRHSAHRRPRLLKHTLTCERRFFKQRANDTK